jgi:hypothetical protein
LHFYSEINNALGQNNSTVFNSLIPCSLLQGISELKTGILVSDNRTLPLFFLNGLDLNWSLVADLRKVHTLKIEKSDVDFQKLHLPS